METRCTMPQLSNKLKEMYLDYVNNFLSVAAFAQYYYISDAAAENIIALGRLILDDKFVNVDCQ